jgi:hypothetical protein
MDLDEMRDYGDKDPHVPPNSAANLGLYASFLHDLSDYINMTEEG